MGTLYSSDSEDSENEEIAGNKGSDNMMISNKTRSNDLTVSGDEEVARVCAAVPLKMTLQDRRRFSEGKAENFSQFGNIRSFL